MPRGALQPCQEARGKQFGHGPRGGPQRCHRRHEQCERLADTAHQQAGFQRATGDNFNLCCLE